MKTKRLLFIVLATLSLSACSSIFDFGNSSNHVHTFDSEWTYDDEYHWHAASCEHKSETSDMERHSWDDGRITKEATTENEGEKLYTCLVCKKTKTEKIDKIHVHSFSDVWSSDKRYHWHKCTGCNEVQDREAHSLNVGEVHAPTYELMGYTLYTCSICGYSYQDNFVDKLQHTFSNEWKYDSNGHWHPCLDAGYENAIINKKNHTFVQTNIEYSNEGTAFATYECVCGYTKQSELTNLFAYDTLEDGSISLYAADGAKTMESLVIPAVYKGKTVSSIKANGFQKLTQLKSVKIASNKSFKTINEHAFDGCSNLAYAVIPESITSIGYYAFYKCSEDLMIYCEVESQPSGYKSGSYNRNYSDVWYGSANQVWWSMEDYYENDEYLFGVTIYGELSISKYKGSAAQLELPEKINDMNIVQVGKYSFSNNKKITSIKLSKRIKSIGTYAFNNCSILSFAVIPQSVTAVERYAFYKCSEDLMIYCEAESQPSGYLNGTYERNYSDVWSGSADQVWWNSIDYNISDDYLFGVLYDGGLQITRYTGSAKEVIIPSTHDGKKITSIGKYSFNGKNRITSVKIPDTVKNIGIHAFDGCTVLQYVSIPDTVTDIGNYAFYSCSADLMIFCGKTSKPDGYKDGTYERNYSDVWSGKNSRVYWGIKDFVITDEFVYGYKLNGSVAIMKYVGEGTRVTVPETYDGKVVSEIAMYAFQGKNRVEYVVCESDISVIGKYAFEGCTMLYGISLQTSADYTIGDYAFANTNLGGNTEYDVGISLDPGCKSIGAYAFQNTQFTTINFLGTKDAFDNISKNSNWKKSSKISKLKCRNYYYDI